MHDEGSLDIVYIAVSFAAFYIMWWMMSSQGVGYPMSSLRAPLERLVATCRTPRARRSRTPGFDR